jgi:hypothetical protein
MKRLRIPTNPLRRKSLIKLRAYLLITFPLFKAKNIRLKKLS